MRGRGERYKLPQISILIIIIIYGPLEKTYASNIIIVCDG